MAIHPQNSHPLTVYCQELLYWVSECQLAGYVPQLQRTKTDPSQIAWLEQKQSLKLQCMTTLF